VEILREVVRRYGTPTYAYDVSRLRSQVTKLRAHLPAAVQILYSLKANASLGLGGVLAGCGLGADVASAGELLIARTAGFPPSDIFVTGPDRTDALLSEMKSLPEIVLSVDSASELPLLAGKGLCPRVLLRLRPDFCSYATCSAGPDSRFGLTLDDLPRCRDFLRSSRIKVIGFHVFSGSQVLSVEGILHHLGGGLDLALRAASILGIRQEIIDVGGGFGVPYAPEDQELDLAAIGAALPAMLARAAPARLVIELGRYLVAQAGWYLTSVIAEQKHHGRRAVVVDGGVHQRGDLCGIGLRQRGVPPAVLDSRTAERFPTDVLGCLSLPSDVLIEASPLPPLAPGDVLAFPNAGAYGLYGSPCHFHSHPPPAEAAFEGSRLELIRPRQPIASVLAGQTLLARQPGSTGTAS
jgi:diaminopimelate decarboxylase